MRPDLGTPPDTIDHEAYLISRGVRPMALLDSVPGSSRGTIAAWGMYLANICRPYNGGTEETAPYPFIIPHPDKDKLHLGIAAYPWVIESYKYLLYKIEEPWQQHFLGLLLGYSPAAIHEFSLRAEKQLRSRPALEE